MTLQPGILEQLGSRGPLAWIFLEDSHDEILHALRDSAAIFVVVVRELVLAGLDLAEEVAFVLCEEGQLANDHNEEDDAACPNVGGLALIRLLLRQIRAHILWCSALHGQFFVFSAPCRKPKINDLDFVAALLIYQYVVELQVAVDHVQAVHVSHSADDLAEDGGCLGLGEALQGLALLDAVVQVLADAELHDEVDVGAGVDHFVKSHDVGVAEVCEDVDLAVECQRCALLLQVLLFVYFECDNVVSLAMHTSLDGGEGALADLQPNLEVMYVEELLWRPATWPCSLGFFPPLDVLVDQAEELLLVLLRKAGATAIDEDLRAAVGECHGAARFANVCTAASLLLRLPGSRHCGLPSASTFFQSRR